MSAAGRGKHVFLSKSSAAISPEMESCGTANPFPALRPPRAMSWR